MTRYQYRGRDSNGASVQGSIEAPSLDAAIATLQRQRVVPVTVEPQIDPSSPALREWDWRRKRVSLDDLAMFCRQMHALSKAGMPVVQSIAGLAELTRSERLQDALNKISVRLRAGAGLASAMREHPDVFSDVFISMINVGENTGRMDQAFRKLIDHLELERLTRGQLSQALRYPLLVMVSMTLAVVIINVMVIPSFSRVFAKLGQDLPLPTRILMTTSDWMIHYWWVMLAVLLAAVGMFLQHIRTPDGALQWDRLKLRLPLVGGIFLRITLARFARTFAMMIEAGVPVLQALNSVAMAIGNRWIQGGVIQIRRGVERGDSVTRSAAGTGIFTPLILQMLAVGEETGTLDTLLHDVADFYEQEVDYALKRLAAAIEPVVLAFLGALVLILALGVFLPMWDLSSAMHR